VFRGLLDAHSRTVTPEMLLAAAQALAGTVSDDEVNAAYIVPSVFHPGVTEAVAAAVRKSVEEVRHHIEETGEIPAQPV
jgi:malate dehydrogenase (oxaloacetate-decarboxylating)